jgi:hypothetical protein
LEVSLPKSGFCQGKSCRLARYSYEYLDYS